MNDIDQDSANHQVTGRQPRPLIYISSGGALALQGRAGGCSNDSMTGQQSLGRLLSGLWPKQPRGETAVCEVRRPGPTCFGMFTALTCE